jgi:putative hydrolase of the HAD superfamily
VPSAILFDLYGTLVPAGTNKARDSVAREVAGILGVDGESFADLYRSTFDVRTRGLLGDLPDTYLELAKRLGGSPDSAQLEEAMVIRLEFARELLEPRATEPVLRGFRSAGYRIGLVTDCSIETPTSWDSSWLHQYFEAVAFSCDLGFRKPDPRIYLSVTEKLHVAAEDCIYVGDGGSNELSGARSLGMKAIRVDEFTSREADRDNEEIDWDGDTIDALSDLLKEYVEPGD